MRRYLAAAAVVLATALSALPGLPAQAKDPGASSARPTDPALVVAARVMAGRPSVGDPDPTLALRDLRLAMPRLSTTDRRQARALLARPTDGAGDVLGDGYTSPSTKKCNTHFCVHYVTNGSDPDAPPAGWVDETLTQLNKVWKLEIDNMGYRKPLSDGTKGGNSKLDVYLKDVWPRGYYGYCATEKRNPKHPYLYSGYCVLDDDFDPAQFGAPALDSLKVTAAHEFFHAAQFATDASEDGWFMESTATWMEERFADDIDDNRQYLSRGQLGRPQISLDKWASADLMQYGNWLWWEYLTSRKGNGVVKAVWNKAGAFQGAPDMYSTQALVSVLKNQGGFKKTFGEYSSGNTLPAKSYPEGAAYTPAPVADTYTLESSAKSSGTHTLNIGHLASRSVRVIPGASLTGGNWALRVTVDGPASDTSPVVNVLTVKLDGSVKRETIALSRTGAGKDTFSFNPSGVSSVTVTLTNASTRFSCWRGKYFSCQGVAKDDGMAFKYTAAAFQK